MTSSTEAPAPGKTPRPVGTTLGAAGPLFLLSLYLFLSSPQGGRLYDAYALRNYGTGVVAFGVLLLVVAGTVIAGAVASAWAVWRGERPPWLARVVLAVNMIQLLLGLRFVL